MQAKSNSNSPLKKLPSFTHPPPFKIPPQEKNGEIDCKPFPQLPKRNQFYEEIWKPPCHQKSPSFK